MKTTNLNFSAGPTVLPPEVLETFKDAVEQYLNTGYSILSLPHRHKAFIDIIEESKALVRTLCQIDDSYEILWMQGGARMQFCMIPMNFLSPTTHAYYLDSGHWAHEAAAYAQHYGHIDILASSRQQQYHTLPTLPSEVNKGHRYLHITTNNTIYGTQWHQLPTYNLPLIADMSSDILSKPQQYSDCDLFYAAAQKNLGTPGTTLVAIKKDLLQHIQPNLPPMMHYGHHVKENSVLNTANVSGIYIALLMLRWIQQQTLPALFAQNKEKAQLLYQHLDDSPFFIPYVTEPSHRSQMNICFNAVNKDLESKFIHLCAQNGILGIEGHRSVGGFRVSLYNAVPLKWVHSLLDIMNHLATIA